MKKILLCLCLLFGYSMANDKDGFFLGAEIGISEVSIAASANGNSVKVELSAPMYGFKAGYRYFFSDLIGLQGYISFKDSFVDVNSSGSLVELQGNGSSHFMPIMANADIIFDFHKTQNYSFDAIVGVGLGFAILNDNSLIGNINTSHSAFYSDARVGIGTSYDNSRLGLVVSFPITQATKKVDGIEYKIKQNYAVALTYDCKF
ncbi:MAG: outer membrane beta-barrel protein [Helicobacteraceae bacterium]|nr:outer membrane beta-barrel protein [Helicobacteraceae bacterium]